MFTDSRNLSLNFFIPASSLEPEAAVVDAELANAEDAVAGVPHPLLVGGVVGEGGHAARVRVVEVEAAPTLDLCIIGCGTCTIFRIIPSIG